MVKHPVLFETFARVDTARQVWEQIKKAQPKILYFYSNKARIEKPDEVKRNNEIRSWIKEIDWSCDLHTFFRDEYVDVYTSVSGSKNWVFSNENTAIILEDDCLPSSGFFEFCDHFLDYYKDVKKISFITGNNYINNTNSKESDHYITRSLHHYGWATWKDRWDSINFDIDVDSIINGNYIAEYFNDDFFLRKYNQLLYKSVSPFVKRTKCWDFIKVLNQFKDKTYAVSPVYNLVQNIGVCGEHTSNASGYIYETGNNDDKMHYPFTGKKELICPNLKYDIEASKVEGIRSYKDLFLMFLHDIYKSSKKLCMK